MGPPAGTSTHLVSLLGREVHNGNGRARTSSLPGRPACTRLRLPRLAVPSIVLLAVIISGCARQEAADREMDCYLLGGKMFVCTIKEGRR